MMRFKNLLIIIAVLSAVIMFTSCQDEPNLVESTQDLNQPGLSKFTLPAGATFVSATFHIYVVTATNQNIDVHRITSPWEECVVTWANFGGSYAPGVEGTFNASTDMAWASCDVTSLVGSWLDGTNPNYGLLLDQLNQTWPRTMYASMRNDFGAYSAYLEIFYTENGGPVVSDTTRCIGDTWIYELDPVRNTCGDWYLYTGWGWDTDLEKQTLIQFDLGYTPPPQVDCETAYAYGESYATSFCSGAISPISGNNWGWTNYIGEGSYDWPIYAGAGQCDISKGTLVGNLSVEYSAGTVTITYELDPGFVLDETHVWVGTTPLPLKKGVYTTAPGQFNHNDENPVVVSGLSGNIWIAAHSGVCWEVQ